jgi:hypothetical protein
LWLSCDLGGVLRDCGWPGDSEFKSDSTVNPSVGVATGKRGDKA